MGDEELFSWFRQEVEEHARLTFEQVEMSGTPADPLIFPEPVIADAVKTNVEVFHQGRRRAWSGVIHRQHEQNPTVAYGPRKRLQNAIYGSVWLYTKFQWNGHFGQWETTNELFAIKIFSRTNIRQMKGRLAEDPMKEISTMQFLGLQNIHILGLIEVLQDEDYIYAVMPYCRGGDLLDVKEGYPEARMPEPEARCCFRQILQGLHQLQSKGICHRDLSLENVLLDNNNCVIIDMGMCLRVPYSAPNREVTITDVTRGTTRRLMKPQGKCGKQNYMSPEIFANEDAFDGFTIDVWAVAAMLYPMLTGFPPYSNATTEDESFQQIVEGNLACRLETWNIELSEDALDLLQRMFQLDPRHRMTLDEILRHPWVTNPEIAIPRVPEILAYDAMQAYQRLFHSGTKTEISVIPYLYNRPEERVDAIVRIGQEDRAYQIFFNVGEWPLDGGYLLFGRMLYKRQDDYRFEELQEDDHRLVTIKIFEPGRILRTVKDVECMYKLGDDHHIQNYLEALTYVDETGDEKACIISSRLRPLKPLSVSVQGGRVTYSNRCCLLTEEQARIIFRQLLECLTYIHEEPNAICHRRICFNNLLINDQGRVVLNDFSWSCPIPDDGSLVNEPDFDYALREQSYLPYLAPEIWQLQAYDARSCDLWSCTSVLFELMTGEPLCTRPDTSDPNFEFLVWAGGFSQSPSNANMSRLLDRIASRPWDPSIQIQIERIKRFDDAFLSRWSVGLRELFENVFCLDPASRWTVDDVLGCQWMRGIVLNPGLWADHLV